MDANERSIEPLTMTTVCAAARIPVSETATPTAFRLGPVRKYGERWVNVMQRTASASASPTSSNRPNTNDWRIRARNEAVAASVLAAFVT